MQVTIKLLTSAVNDLLMGRQFYEKQRKGLGGYFIESLLSDINKLNLYAGCHPQYFGYYRMLAKKFPYAIYYKMDGKTVVLIWRILDMRRNPSKTQENLR